MKQKIRLGDCYALTIHKRKQYTIRYISLLAVLTSMCLYARAQRPDSSGPVLSGIVTDTARVPIQGATITIENGTGTAVTDSDGYFSLRATNQEGVLSIYHIGYFKQKVPFSGRNDAKSITIQLEPSSSMLDETIVIGYGTSSKRFNTGNVARVTAEEITATPAFNPIASLAGRVPGLIVSQSNGVMGSSFEVQLRGMNSITQGSEPLFIINGVPYTNGNEFLNTIITASGNPSTPNNMQGAGLSPFNLINAEDIVSIEVLKDADALAIYGSRGANGVILITTRSGEAGRTRVNVNISRGIGRAPHSFRFLNTQEYVAMRKEAFANDGVVPSADPGEPGYAPDIMLWDTTRYTDLQELLTGGTANYTNLQTSLSGGTKQTHFVIGSAYKLETGVLPGKQSNNLASLTSRLSHQSTNGRLMLSLTSTLSRSTNHTTTTDLSTFLTLPPNLPMLYDSNGNLNWEENGHRFENPMAYLERRYRAASSGSLHNLSVSYELLPGLTAKGSFGYNTNNVTERAMVPQRAFDPTKNMRSSLRLADNSSSSWIAEPQLAYTDRFNKLKFSALIGGTWQQTERSNRSMRGDGFADDLMLGAIEGANDLTVTNGYVQYRYQAIFGRITLNHADKYLLNFSGRRDGSSRFGPGRQYANFGAIGVAYILSNERFLNNNPLLSFAKLRGSYGVTGNDQISDYQYLDAWGQSFFHYVDGQGIKPVRLFNPRYAWEVNHKFEGALELGFLNDKLLVTAAFFQNKSSNQLINYKLPIQTGFANVLRNFDAIVQNRGWEFSLNVQLMRHDRLQWDMQLNWTTQRNRLLEFPNLATSSYANTLVIGKSLRVDQGYAWLGVNPETGIYDYQDVNGDGSVSGRNDYIILEDTDPKWYGGISQSLYFKGFRFDVLFDFRKQTGKKFFSQSAMLMPGQEANQPSVVMDRWHGGNTKTNIQRFGALTGTPAYQAYQSRLRSSSGIYTDASFLKCRSLTLSKSFSNEVFKKFGLTQLQLNIQAQNLFTLTSFDIGDPETSNHLTLPPLRTFHVGLNLQF